MKNRVFAAIVVYNPNIERLKENVNSVLSQVDKLIIVINGKESFYIGKTLSLTDKIELIKNHKNKGIAHALNQAMEKAEQQGAEWVLTLDQDTVITNDLVEKLLARSNNERVGIIAPNYVDRNYYRDSSKHNGWKYVFSCITSGSLTNTEIWRQIGGFDDELFIDFVDFDYCARLIESGYAIIMDYSIHMIHEIGMSERKYIGKYSIIVRNHSPLRKYYIFRNVSVFCNRYPQFCKMYVDKNKYFMTELIAVLFYEKNKIVKLIAMIHGLFSSRKIIKRDNRKKKSELKKHRERIKMNDYNYSREKE